jgi:hypothetical protein
MEEALDAIPSDIEARDKAAGHRIAAAVLRRMGSLDAVMEPCCAASRPSRPSGRCGSARRSCCCSARRPMRRCRGVSLAPKPLAGLVNAVLRKVAEEGPEALEDLDGSGSTRRPGSGPPGSGAWLGCQGHRGGASDRGAAGPLAEAGRRRCRKGRSCCPTARRACRPGRASRSFRASPRAISGPRTPPPPCRRSC